MQYRILGPLEVVSDGVDGAAGVAVDLGSPKQRAVLASLLLEPGRAVGTERIVDQVWGDDVPVNVSSSLQAYVSNLRRLLRDDTVTSPIVRQAPGYRLDVADSALDLRQFVAAADTAHAAVRDADWAAAVASADEALALWRGEVLADFRDSEWVRAAAVPLDERRTRCLEDLVTALLGLDRTSAALTVARRLHSEQPLREHATWLLAVALHRDGRTTEALDELRSFARLLDDELGLEAGPDMRELQSAVLRHDPTIARWPGTRDRAVRPVEPAPARETVRETADTGTLVGRSGELATVDAALDEVAQGAVRWIVLSGPAGIGKTRLAEEALARAAGRSARLLRAQCPDDDGVPPWWPVAQIVRALGADPDVVLAQDPGAEADRARFAVYERVRDLLVDAAASGPLAVLVDDVQWADPSSLRLLAHLTFALDAVPIAFVLTARTGAGGSDLRRVFDATARRPGTRRINVPALAGAEVGELVRRVSGDEVSRDEATLLLTRTGGNPFFVSEYARLPRSERESGEIPLAIRSVLDRRLEALDAGTLQVLRTAAVIGDVLDIALLRRVTRLDVDELADMLDEAADERIVVIAPGSRNYTFAHGLLRDELLAGMTDARRARIHARVAAAIDDAAGPDDLVRRAGHLLAALPLVEPEEVFEACRAAAADSDARQHADSAAHWWEAAVSAYDQLTGRTPEQRDELVARRLFALIRAGRGQTVYEVVDAEIASALDAGRFGAVGTLCSLLMRSSGAWPWAAFGEDPGPLVATLQSAAPRVAGDAAAHARVLAALAIGSCYHPHGSVPDGLSREALDIAERLGDPDVLADAVLGRCLTFSGVAARVHECTGLLARLDDLPHAYADVDEVIRHGLSTMLTAHLGDFAATAEHVRLGSIGADALRLPISRVQFRLAESVIALWHGRFDEAERLFDEGIRLREQTELYFGWARLGLVVSRWEQGCPLTLLDEPSDEIETLEQALIAVAEGRTADADRLVTEWLDADGPVIWTSHASWTLLAHLVADAGLVHHAPRLIELLRPLRGLVALGGQLTAVGTVSLALARLYELTGDRALAREEAVSALDLSLRSGGVPSELRCRAFLAALDGPDDQSATQRRNAS